MKTGNSKITQVRHQREALNSSIGTPKIQVDPLFLKL